jgi:putative DNA primase/helicase
MAGPSRYRQALWCVFAGTTNPTGVGYLADTTGNRRFWPVRVGNINLSLLAENRDQLFAEAVVCYRKNEPWWPTTADERLDLGEAQAERQAPEAWELSINRWLHTYVLGENEMLTVELIAKLALGIGVGDIDRATETRIGIVMNKLGFRSRKVTDPLTKDPARVYERSE